MEIHPGMLDVALIQSLLRKGVVDDVAGEYGHLVVDECHHLPAFSFEQVARRAKARYVLGLSATITRKDGHHPIVFNEKLPIQFDQCGHMEVDFLCSEVRLVVELDGPQNLSDVEAYRRDRRKDALLQEHGYFNGIFKGVAGGKRDYGMLGAPKWPNCTERWLKRRTRMPSA